MGSGEPKPECQQKLASQSAMSSYTGASRPAWMDVAISAPKSDPDALVYTASPGAMLYRHICFNCHGPKADGRGLQADALSSSSDGDARPANFREGLFGPSTSPDTNLLNVFSVGTVTPDLNVALSWASRYMAWMTLGGTLKIIPQDIIHLVEATKIFGVRRGHNLQFLPGSNGVTANMLNLAKGLCSVVLPDPSNVPAYYGTGDIVTFSRGRCTSFYPPYNADRHALHLQERRQGDVADPVHGVQPAGGAGLLDQRQERRRHL